MRILRVSIVLIIISLLLCCEYNVQKKRQESMVFVKAGDKLSESGHYEEAEQSYNDAIKIDYTNAIAYFNRGVNRGKGLKDYEGAIKDYTEYLKTCPEDPAAYYYRALNRARSKEKDYIGAIQDCTKAIEVDPKYKDAYYYRGEMKILLKDRLGACLDFSRAGELGRDDAYKMIQENCQNF